MSVITLVSALVSAYLIPWLRSKTSVTQLDKVAYYTEMAVRAAEQLFTPDQWEKKKEYVYGYILDLVNTKLNIRLDQEDVNIIIEGVVNEVKHKD